MKYIQFFNHISIEEIDKVGGKNASLGEMYKNLSSKGISVPNGFATTSDAYWLLLEENGIKDSIKNKPTEIIERKKPVGLKPVEKNEMEINLTAQ